MATLLPGKAEGVRTTLGFQKQLVLSNTLMNPHLINPTFSTSSYVHCDFVRCLQHCKIYPISLQNERLNLLLFYSVSYLG